jgi:hypothetical protein
MFSIPGRDDEVEVPGLDRGRRVHRRLHRRSALAVDRWSRRPVSASRRSATATRPTFSACSPTCETQPIWTSSTAPGSSVEPLRQPAQHLGGELVGPHRRERAVPLADRAADGVDDQGIAH